MFSLSGPIDSGLPSRKRPCQPCARAPGLPADDTQDGAWRVPAVRRRGLEPQPHALPGSAAPIPRGSCFSGNCSLSCPKGAAPPAPWGRMGAGLSRVLSCPALSPGSWPTPLGSPDMKATPEEESHTSCRADPPPRLLARPPPARGAPLTQAASAEAVVGPRLWLGLVAVEDLLHQLLHGEARAAVPVAAGPLDAVDYGEREAEGWSEVTGRRGSTREGWDLGPLRT